jgi:hypothetical protein
LKKKEKDYEINSGLLGTKRVILNKLVNYLKYNLVINSDDVIKELYDFSISIVLGLKI